MNPVITKVVCIGQHIIGIRMNRRQLPASCVAVLFVQDKILIIRYADSDRAVFELIQMIILPTHHDLYHIVEFIECDVARYSEPTPD